MKNMSDIEKKPVKKLLRIERLEKSRSGRSLCYVDQDVLRDLGINTGDIVKIIGKKITTGVAVSSVSDKGKGIIRLDGIQRLNTGSTIGEFVQIKPAPAIPAIEVELAPTRRLYEIGRQSEAIKAKLIDKPVLPGDIVDTEAAIVQGSDFSNPMEGFMKMFSTGRMTKKPTLGPLRLIVVRIKPENRVVRITRETRIRITKKIALLNTSGEIITYDDVGGLSNEIQRIREVVELPIRHPELFQRLHIDPPRGVIFYGPPGTGKTLMAKAVSQESNANFVIINGPEIMSKFYGTSEENLRNAFLEAEKMAPSIVFIDEIDAIAPKRKDMTGEVERRVVSQLLTLLDGSQTREGVITIGATNRLDAIDEALRRPGRFDTEISFHVPNKKGRKEIFQIHTRGMPLADDVDLDYYADVSHGYVGADIMGTVREAALNAIRDILPSINLDDPIPGDIIQKLYVNDDHFLKALKVIKPSATREFAIDIPDVSWEDIGGLEEVKQELIEAVEWPITHRKIFKKAGIRPISGILLFGPPGCGKTLLAQAIANETQSNLLTVKGPELINVYVGESERKVRELFKKARELSPTIIYFDEIEAISASRGQYKGSHTFDTLITQLLTEMDGIESSRGIVIVASTNRPDLVDPAFLRPGRIDRSVYVPAPDYEGRRKILKVHTKKMPLDDNISIKKIALVTDGFSGADLENLCREAGMQAIREDKEKFKKVKNKHFEFALTKIGSTLPKETIEKYDTMAKQQFQAQKIRDSESGLYK
jgi:transitional endoplasmic reticulum ATPase